MSQGEEQGEAPAVAEPQDGERAPNDDAAHVRILDFSQPTKFTTELRRRIGRALEAFCDGLGAWMAGELKGRRRGRAGRGKPAHVGGRQGAAPRRGRVAVEAESIERNMLLSVELALVLQSLECLLGGEATQAPAERHLTEIDWVLTRGVLDAMVHQLSVAWDGLGGTELTRGERRRRGRRRRAHADRRTDSFGVARGQDRRPRLGRLAADPVGRDRADHQQHPRRRQRAAQRRPAGRRGAARGVAGAQVLLRAEVGSVQMPIERMLELDARRAAGARESAEDGVLLFAEGSRSVAGVPGAAARAARSS